MSSGAHVTRPGQCSWSPRRLMTSDTVSSNIRLVPVDLPTITGVDRRVSIRTTSAISRTRAPDTAGSDWPRLRPADTSQLDSVSGHWLVAARHCRSEQPATAVGGMAMKNTAVLVFSLSLAGSTLLAQNDPVRSLLSKDLAGVPGKELSMITVEYAPGAIDPGAYASCAGAGLRPRRLDRDAGQR